MAGRSLYDNQMSIRAIARQKSKTIAMIPNSLLNMGKETRLLQLIPMENTLTRIEDFYIKITNCASKGATSGNFGIDISKSNGSGKETGILTIRQPFDKDISVCYGEILETPALRYPKTDLELTNSLSNYTIDDECSLSIYLINSTDIAIVDLFAFINISINETKVES